MTSIHRPGTEASEPPLLVGVDGCRGGWVAAVATAAAPHRLLEVIVLDHIAPVLHWLGTDRVAMVAIDMPMGLTEAGPRRCDVETRARLGARASSVFTTPPRALLRCATHAEAVALGRSIDGRGISIQAFNLVPKIAQLDHALGPDPEPALFDRFIEAHPESAFAQLAGEPLTTRKRTAEGRRERLALLDEVFASGTELLGGRHRGAAPDDVLDAAILVRTAHRVLTGSATILGDGERDRHGIPMRVAI
jgi:predicted RNase H-like nuclease